MSALSSSEELPRIESPADLAPYLTITLLRVIGDRAIARNRLVEFLRRVLSAKGRAADARLLSESMLPVERGAEDPGIDFLYTVTRVVRREPGWAGPDSGLLDVENELTIALFRNDLAAICGSTPRYAQLKKWITRDLAPFAFVPPEVVEDTFSGDGKMVWLSAVHRRRTTKPDTKALGGLRLQDAMNPEADRSFEMRAAKVDFQPDDDDAVLRDSLSITPRESRISWRRAPMGLFIAATVEAFDRLEKAIAGSDLEPLFDCLAVEVRDLTDVWGAYDIRVTDPDTVRGEPGADEDETAHAGLLLGGVIEVRGDSTSPVATLDVGRDGAVAGTLTITPVLARSGFELQVGVGDSSNEAVVREIREAIDNSDLLTVHYESGHTFTRGRVFRERLTSPPFRNIRFEDFAGYEVNREKPALNAGTTLHEAIALPDDRSLFAWVVDHYRAGWLLCDDGAGEIADFLHLADDGTLTVIHVKAATSTSPNRKIAVTRFEQVVSQAEKNARYLQNDNLLNHLDPDRVGGSAAWHDGGRVPAADVVAQLGVRVASDRTVVHIVQPHLLCAVHDSARAAIDAGKPTRDSRSLVLLDTLLNSTRQTITAHAQDLWVVGSTSA